MLWTGDGEMFAGQLLLQLGRSQLLHVMALPIAADESYLRALRCTRGAQCNVETEPAWWQPRSLAATINENLGLTEVSVLLPISSARFKDPALAPAHHGMKVQT